MKVGDKVKLSRAYKQYACARARGEAKSKPGYDRLARDNYWYRELLRRYGNAIGTVDTLDRGVLRPIYKVRIESFRVISFDEWDLTVVEEVKDLYGTIL